MTPILCHYVLPIGAGLTAGTRAMERITSHISKAVNIAISSPWAIFVAGTVALPLFFFGDRTGLDRQRLDLTFSSTRRHS